MIEKFSTTNYSLRPTAIWTMTIMVVLSCQSLPWHMSMIPDPEMRPYQEPISAERREDLIIGIAAGAMRIYEYFRRPSPREMSFVSESSTYRRALHKVGRNEPCPCGSGKKFKHCCGKITLH